MRLCSVATRTRRNRCREGRHEQRALSRRCAHAARCAAQQIPAMSSSRAIYRDRYHALPMSPTLM